MSAFAETAAELRRVVRQPFAWAFAAILILLGAWQFLLGVSAFLRAQAAGAGGAGFTDTVIASHWLGFVQLCLVLVPILTMRALTDAPGAAPAQPAVPPRRHRVLSVFAARVVMLWVVLAITASMPLLLARAASLDWGQFGAGLLATALCVAALAAIGVACSAFVRDSALAAVLAILIGEVLSLIDAGVRAPAGDAGWLGYLALHSHLEPTLRGLVRSEDIVYFLLLAGVALALADHRVASRREQS